MDKSEGQTVWEFWSSNLFGAWDMVSRSKSGRSFSGVCYIYHGLEINMVSRIIGRIVSGRENHGKILLLCHV